MDGRRDARLPVRRRRARRASSPATSAAPARTRRPAPRLARPCMSLAERSNRRAARLSARRISARCASRARPTRSACGSPRSAFARASQMLHRAGARFVTLLLAETPSRHSMGVFAMRGDLVVAARADAGAARPPTYTALGAVVAGGAVGRAGARRPRRRSPGRLSRSARPDRARRGQLDRRLAGLDVFSLPYRPGALRGLRGDPVPDRDRRRGRAAVADPPVLQAPRTGAPRSQGSNRDEAVHVAERIAGIASVAYALAFSQAVERALGRRSRRRAPSAGAPSTPSWSGSPTTST